MSAAAHALPSRELVLDRYRPLRPLGSGGSGSVWLARDEQTGLDVALKIVPREGKAADRAEREAEAASRLRHERCLRAYGFGSDSGHVYIAYEYVSGRTLRDAMRAGELRDGQAIEAAAQILDGLAHAHSRGIIHRDVKPSNVLLAEDEGISVRLLDFGLAQFDEAETLTAVGDVPGTLAYISPERLCGEEACAASDVWGVGVLLWEALAGKHPFWGVPLSKMAGTIEAGAPPLAAGAPGPAETPARRDRARAGARPGQAATRGRAGERAAGRAVGRPALDEARKCRLNTNSEPPASLPPPRRARRRRRRGDAAVLPLGRRRRRSRSRLVSLRSGRLERASRSRSRRRSSRSATSRSAWRSSTAPSRSPGSPCPGATRASGLPSSQARCSRRSACWRSFRSRSPGAAAPRDALRRRSPRSRSQPSPPACAAGISRSAKEPCHRWTSRAPTAPPPRPRRSCEAVPPGLALEALALAAIAVALPYARTPWRIAGLGAGALAATLLAAPVRTGSAARRSRLAHLRRARAQVRALDSFAGGTCPPDRMSVLRSIEQKIEGLFEGMFGRAFRTHVQPVELARKLAKEMDEHRTISVSRVYVPNEYSVYLSEADREQFAGYEGSLIGELQDYLVEHARRESYALLTPAEGPDADGRRPVGR